MIFFILRGKILLDRKKKIPARHSSGVKKTSITRRTVIDMLVLCGIH